MNQLFRVCQKVGLLVVVALLSALAVAIPFILTFGNKPAGLRGVAVLAAGPDRHTIARPVSLLSVPDLTVESGTLAIQRQAGSAKSNSSVQADLVALEAGHHALVLDAGVIRIVLTPESRGPRPAPGRYVDAPSSSIKNNSEFRDDERKNALIDADALAPIIRALADHRYTALALRGCAVLFENSHGNVARLDDVNLDITKRSKSEIRVQGTFRFRGETVEILSDIGTAPLAEERVASVPVSTRLNSRLLKAKFDGKLVLSSPVQIVADDASMEMMSVALGGQWLGLPWPTSEGKDTFGARGRLAWSSRAIAFENATFSLGGNRAAGALSLTYGGDRPLIAGTLAAKHLNLERFFKRATETSTLSIAAAELWLAHLGVPAWSGFSAFVSAVDADVRISAQKLTGTGFDAASAAVALSLNNGKMLADIAEVEFYNGGTANLQFSFDVSSTTPHASLRARLGGIEISDAMRHVFDHELLVGRGDMSVDLNGNGIDRAAFMSSANGKVTISVPETATLKLPAREDGTTHQLFAGQPISLEQLETSIVMANGVATFAPLTAKSQYGPLTAKGWVSVPRQFLDLEVIVSTSRQNDATAPGANRYVVHKMNVVGPWRAPKIISSDIVDRSSAPGSDEPKLTPGAEGTPQAPL